MIFFFLVGYLRIRSKCNLGARGFSRAVSAFGQVLKSEWLRRSCLRPLAEHVSACGRRNEAPRHTREKTSGTQGSQNDGQTETLSVDRL